MLHFAYVSRSMPPTSLQRGRLVTSTAYSDLGIGKIKEVSENEVLLEYFVSPVQCLERSVPRTSLRAVSLPRQTRCYLEVDGRLAAGRIFDVIDGGYIVRLPNDLEKIVSEKDLFVRCGLPIEDPTDILVAQAIETPFFFIQRQAFLKSITEQRAASQGLSALLSAGIQLYPHQVEVVRRVLEDPIQRYLLADEVGLGKTIEAGILARQFLLDAPDQDIYFIVPGHLVEQWSQELEGKLGFAEFEGHYEVVPFDELDSLEVAPEACAAIIVDEAHHLVSGAFSSAPREKERYRHLQKLAQLSPRLLLLSATPVLHSEQQFLAMLHLLDPDAYPLDDLDSFIRKVSGRQAIGKLLLNLKETAHPVVLRSAVQRIAQSFEEDPRVQELTTQLIEALQDEAARVPLIRTLRVHLSETYRLHRRMLRNRRESVTSIANHRGAFIAEYDLDERTGDLAELLDEWRVSARRALEEAPEQDPLAWQNLFLLLVEASGTSLEIFAELVNRRLGKPSAPWLKQNFSAQELALIDKLPQFPEEAALLDSMFKLVGTPSEDGDRLKLLQQLLTRNFRVQFGQGSGKVVVFTSYPRVAELLHAHFVKLYGQDHVARHLAADRPSNRDSELNRFKRRTECWLLFADASGEEGLNLQHANAIIHYDLPFNPNRIEQRMGRLDRLGRSHELRTWALAGADHDLALHGTWLEILEKGFGVFKESIASLQFMIDTSLPMLREVAFQEGSEGLRREGERLTETIQAELVRIAEQQAIDEIDAREQGASFAFETLAAMDAKTQEHRNALKGWAERALQFHLKFHGNGTYIYQHRENTLVPRSEFAAYVDRQDGTAAVFDRAEAEGQRNVRVFRIGHPFVDALAQYLEWDDRGKVFAMWRAHPDWPEDREPWFGFYLTYRVEADPQPALEVVSKTWGRLGDTHALKRRLEALSGPMFVPIAIDARTGLETRDELVLDLLNRSAGRDEDVNLGSRQEFIDRFISPAYWGQSCRQAREVSELALRSNAAFLERLASLEKHAIRQLDFRLTQLRQRLERLRTEGNFTETRFLEQEIAAEAALNQAIIQGITQPRVLLDAIGFVVIANRKPSLDTLP